MVILRPALAALLLVACLAFRPAGLSAQPRLCAVVLDGVWDNRPDTSARDRFASFAQLLWLRDFPGYDEAREWLAVFEIDLDRIPFRPGGLTPLRDWPRWSAALAQLDPAQSADARNVAAFLQTANARARRIWEECFRSEGLRLSWRLGAEPGLFTLLLRWNPARPQDLTVHTAWHEIAPPLACLRELKSIHLVGADGREIACDRRSVRDPIVIRVIAAAQPWLVQLLLPPLRAAPANP
jgi:hypothetical protein